MDQSAQDSLFGLQVGFTTGRSFKDISKWATFISIVFFICVGIALLALAFGGSAIIQLYSTGFGLLAANFVGIFIALGIAFLLIYLFATVMLLRFASLIKRAIESQDQGAFNQSLKAFKNYFVITGIISIVGFLYGILTLIITIVPEVISGIL